MMEFVIRIHWMIREFITEMRTGLFKETRKLHIPG